MSRGGFEFRLERVRALRERAEDAAKEHLAAAMAERDRWAARLDDAAARLAAARAALGGSAGGSIADLLAHQAFVERSEREHAAAELDLSRQDAEVEARRVALQAAARERRVLEQLRDKQEAAWRRATARAEAVRLDEFAITGFARRAGA